MNDTRLEGRPSAGVVGSTQDLARLAVAWLRPDGDRETDPRPIYQAVPAEPRRHRARLWSFHVHAHGDSDLKCAATNRTGWATGRREFWSLRSKWRADAAQRARTDRSRGDEYREFRTRGRCRCGRAGQVRCVSSRLVRERFDPHYGWHLTLTAHWSHSITRWMIWPTRLVARASSRWFDFARSVEPRSSSETKVTFRRFGRHCGVVDSVLQSSDVCLASTWYTSRVL